MIGDHVIGELHGIAPIDVPPNQAMTSCHFQKINWLRKK